MPFVLHHNATQQIYACLLRNSYDLTYYGVKYWDEEESASLGLAEFIVSHDAREANAWSLLEIDEQVLKICNVKLKNNLSYNCYLGANGRPYVESQERSANP